MVGEFWWKVLTCCQNAHFLVALHEQPGCRSNQAPGCAAQSNPANKGANPTLGVGSCAVTVPHRIKHIGGSWSLP